MRNLFQLEEVKWPNKGKKQEAGSGSDNLIKRAFDRSQKEIVFKSPTNEQQPVASSPPTANSRHTEATIVSVSPKQTQFSNEVMASTFLDNDRWVMEVKKILEPDKHCKIK